MVWDGGWLGMVGGASRKLQVVKLQVQCLSCFCFLLFCLETNDKFSFKQHTVRTSNTGNVEFLNGVKAHVR